MVGVRVTSGVALAMALLLACALLATPAFAQANARGGTLQYVDCDQIVSVAAIQYHVRDVSQELDITQEQVRACIGDDGADTKDDVLADTIVEGALPDTGGLSVPALAAYALVVAGALSLVRLIGRRR